ncbi:multidrug effflux MFS transporter [Xenorhabdus bharatensis]|uniref:multidrug effflux MFS transporter n=1 Tax=Xenorhabdus bharatensis TaxID=3136256 RepID=UPI0030F47C54
MSRFEQNKIPAFALFLLALMTAFDVMAIDMYLPAFNAIKESLNTDLVKVETSLSLFLVGLAIGQGMLGPVIDHYGRRTPLLLGILIFSLASLLTSTTDDIVLFNIGRIVQGLSGAVTLVVPRAIISDTCDAHTSARLFTILMQIVVIGPIIAPPLGSILLSVFGWRAIFLMLFALSFFTLIAAYRFIPESLPKESRQTGSLSKQLYSYIKVTKNSYFLMNVLSSSFVMGTLFAYINSSAFIFLNHFGFTPKVYSYFFAANAVGMVFFGFINMKLLKFYKAAVVLKWSLLANLFFVMLLLISVTAGLTSIYFVIPLLFMSVATLSLLFGNGISVTMNSVSAAETGTASAVLGMIQYLFGGCAGLLVGLLSTGTLSGVALTMFICSAGALATYHMAKEPQDENDASEVLVK